MVGAVENALQVDLHPINMSIEHPFVAYFLLRVTICTQGSMHSILNLSILD